MSFENYNPNTSMRPPPPAKYNVGDKVNLHSKAVENEYGCENSMLGNNTWTVNTVTPKIREWVEYDAHLAGNITHKTPTNVYSVSKKGNGGYSCDVLVEEHNIKKKVGGGKRKTKKGKRKIKKSRKSRKLKRRKTRRS